MKWSLRPDWKKTKSHSNSRVSFHKAPTKNDNFTLKIDSETLNISKTEATKNDLNALGVNDKRKLISAFFV